MKRVGLLALAASVLVTGWGTRLGLLPSGHSVERVELMETLGVDQGEQVVLTVSGGEGDTAWTGAGETVADALLDIQTQSHRYVSYGQISGCLVGEAAAQAGLQPLLDFFQRDTELRLSTELYVVREGTAAELMNAMNQEGTTIAQGLEAMALDDQRLSQGDAHTIRDVLVGLEDNGCALVPGIALGERGAEGCGYACLQQGTLVGWIQPENAPGVNLLTGHLTGELVTLPLESGGWVSIRLEGASCQWEPELAGETVTGLTAQVQVNGTVVQISGAANLGEEPVWQGLETALAQQLSQEGAAVLRQCQQWAGDFLHLKNQVELAKPALRPAVEEHWEEWFPALSICVEVSAQVDGTEAVAGG